MSYLALHQSEAFSQMKMDKTFFFFFDRITFWNQNQNAASIDEWSRWKVKLLTNQKLWNRLQRNKKINPKVLTVLLNKKKSGHSNKKKKHNVTHCFSFFVVDQHFSCWLAPLGSEGVEQSVMPSVDEAAAAVVVVEEEVKGAGLQSGSSLVVWNSRGFSSSAWTARWSDGSERLRSIFGSRSWTCSIATRIWRRGTNGGLPFFSFFLRIE